MLENLQQRFRNKTFFQIKELCHLDDTSMRVTADDVNFITNPEYLTVRKVKKKEKKKEATTKMLVNCLIKTWFAQIRLHITVNNVQYSFFQL